MPHSLLSFPQLSTPRPDINSLPEVSSNMKPKQAIAAFLAAFSIVVLVVPAAKAECCEGRSIQNARLCNDLTDGTPCCAYGKCNIFCCQCENGCRADDNVSMIDYQRFRLPCRQGGSRCPWTQWNHDNQPNNGHDKHHHHDDKRGVHEDAPGSIGKLGRREDCVDTSFAAADKNGDGVLDVTEYLDFMDVDEPLELNTKGKKSLGVWEGYFRSFDTNNKGYVTLADLNNATLDSISVSNLPDINSQTPSADGNGSHLHACSHKEDVISSTHPKFGSELHGQRNVTTAQNSTSTPSSTAVRVPFDVPTTLSKIHSKRSPRPLMMCTPMAKGLPTDVPILRKVQEDEKALSHCIDGYGKKIVVDYRTEYPMEAQEMADGGTNKGHGYATPCWDRLGFPVKCSRRKLRARGALSVSEVKDAGKDVSQTLGTLMARNTDHVWEIIMGTIGGVVSALAAASIPSRYKWLGNAEEVEGKAVSKILNSGRPASELEEEARFGYGGELLKPLRFKNKPKDAGVEGAGKGVNAPAQEGEKPPAREGESSAQEGGKPPAQEGGKPPAQEEENLRGDAPLRYPGEDLRYKNNGKDAPTDSKPAREPSEDTLIHHEVDWAAAEAMGPGMEPGSGHSSGVELSDKNRDKGKGPAEEEEAVKAETSSSEERVFLRPPPPRSGRKGEPSSSKKPVEDKGEKAAQGKGEKASKAKAKNPAHERQKAPAQDEPTGDFRGAESKQGGAEKEP